VEPQNIGQLRMPLKLIRLQGSYQHLWDYEQVLQLDWRACH
jgi:hypothetical protein